MNYTYIILYSLLLANFNFTYGQYDLKKISEEMVFNKPPFQECHASTILEINQNEILVAAFGGTKEGKKDVSIWLTRKKNSVWQTPIIVDTGKSNYKTEYPCWNPVLFKSVSGKITLFYKLGPSPREWWGMEKNSIDNGLTWTKAKELPKNILGPIKNKPFQLFNGTILSPSSTETRTYGELSWKIHVEKSSDDGISWKKIPIDPFTKYDVIQPSILNLGNGKLKLLCRSRNNFIMESFSNNNGESWSKISKTKLPNPNSGTDAVTLSNGLHLLVYNPLKNGKNDRSKLSIAISIDGNTWEDIYSLENNLKGEYSYPAIIESNDNRIHVSYTYDRKNIKYSVFEVVNK